MLAPSFHAFSGVVLVRPREVLRFEDFAQDDKKGAPLRIPSPVAEFVGNGKGFRSLFPRSRQAAAQQQLLQTRAPRALRYAFKHLDHTPLHEQKQRR